MSSDLVWVVVFSALTAAAVSHVVLAFAIWKFYRWANTVLERFRDKLLEGAIAAMRAGYLARQTSKEDNRGH